MKRLAASLQEPLLALARAAGAAILAARAAATPGVDGRLQGSTKADGSPVTAADLAAHRLIVAGLHQLDPGACVISEEDGDATRSRPVDGRYWLVDPLDGTREFQRGSPEFTVNIGLVEHDLPVFGVVFAPALDLLYWGGDRFGAWRQEGATRRRCRVAPLPRSGESWRVVASRSHLDADTQAWIAARGASDLLAVGSSLKFCRVADGSAHVYPRLAPTHEWDTAAAQAVLEGAGGSVCTPAGARLSYGHPGEPHAGFIAAAGRISAAS